MWRPLAKLTCLLALSDLRALDLDAVLLHHAAIDAAVATLAAPLDLFVMPGDAGCVVTAVEAELEGEDGHDEHDDDHKDHDHEDHDGEHHDDHKDADHDEHADEDHEEDHDAHADDAGHTEFHAEYTLTCDAPDQLTEISFAYFEAFPNALEVEVQIITATGAQAFEVERDDPVLDLER